MTTGPAGWWSRGANAGRLPVGVVVGGDHAAFRAGIPVPTALSDASALADVLLAALEDYGSDFVVVFSDVTVEAEAMGATVRWTDDDPPRVETGVAAERIRSLDPDRDGRLPVILGAARRIVDAVGDRMPVLVSLKGPFSLAALTTGLEALLTAAIDEPRAARALLDTVTESQVRYARAIVGTGGIPLVGDPFASGSVLGPSHFDALARPGLARVVEEIHALSSPAALHVCGDANPVLESLLAVGADLLHLEQVDLERADAGGAVLMGGIPTETLLSTESLEDVVRDAVAAVPDRRRHVLATVCDVPTRADPGRVRALVVEMRRQS